MSKAFAATAVLRLVEQGRLDLDEDVNNRLKAWKVPPSPYTAGAEGRTAAPDPQPHRRPDG